MWKAAVFVYLLLNMQVTGAVDETSGPAREKSKPERGEAPGEAVGTSSAPGRPQSPGFVGNLLVVPMDGSHWVGVKALAQEMGRRGHRVTVVIPEVSFRMGPGKHYHTVTFPVPYDKAFVEHIMESQQELLSKSNQALTEKIKKKFAQIQRIAGLLHTTAESLLFNQSLILHLAQQVRTQAQVAHSSFRLGHSQLKGKNDRLLHALQVEEPAKSAMHQILVLLTVLFFIC